LGNKESNSIVKILAFVFFQLLAFPLLVLFRRLDSNTLTSWRWTLGPETFSHLLPFLVAGILLACFAAKYIKVEKFPPVVLCLLTAVLVIPLAFLPELLLDSGRYFLQAKYLATHGFLGYWRGWGGAVWAWTDMPLSSLLYGSIFFLMGESRVYCQVLNICLFGLSAGLVYGCGRILWGKRTGSYAGLLLLGSPFMLIQVPQLLNDIHVMFCLVLTLYSSLRLLDKGRMLWSFFLVIGLCLTVFVKYSTWPMLPLLLLALSFYGNRSGRFVGRYFLTLMVGASVVGLLLLSKWQLIISQIHFLKTYQLVGLSQWQEGFFSTLLYQCNPFIFFFAAYGCWQAFRLKDYRFLVVGWFPLLVVFLGIERSRYLIPFFPFLILAAAYGLRNITGEWPARCGVFCVVIWSLLIGYGAYKPFLENTSMANLMDVGNDLSAMATPVVAVLPLAQSKSSGNTAAVIPILDLYIDKEIVLAGSAIYELQRQEEYITSLQFSREIPLSRYYRAWRRGKERLLVVVADEQVESDGIPRSIAEINMELIKSYTKQQTPYRFKSLISLFSLPSQQ